MHMREDTCYQKDNMRVLAVATYNHFMQIVILWLLHNCVPIKTIAWECLLDIYCVINSLILCSYVDFTFSLACNGSNTVSSELTEGSVMLQYRTSADWITTNSTSGKYGLTVFDACTADSFVMVLL